MLTTELIRLKTRVRLLLLPGYQPRRLGKTRTSFHELNWKGAASSSNLENPYRWCPSYCFCPIQSLFLFISSLSDRVCGWASRIYPGSSLLRPKLAKRHHSANFLLGYRTTCQTVSRFKCNRFMAVEIVSHCLSVKVLMKQGLR